MARILVTGCAGFIGSHLVEALLGRGDEVGGIDNFNDYYDPRVKRRNLIRAAVHPRFTLWERDICEESAVRAVFEVFRPEVVVHLAARAGVRPSIQDPNLYHRVNVIGSQHMLDACRDFGALRLVFASSSSVYGGSDRIPFREDDPVARPISPYAATKRMNELQACVYSHLYGLRVTMLRFFTVYGPRQRPDMAIHKFARAILEGRPVTMYGDGSSRRDYTYIDDIISGVLAAIDHPRPYDLFNLGESRTVSLTELIGLLESVLGRRAVIDRQPPQPGDVPMTCADITHARTVLGWEPRTPIEEGLRHFADWLADPW